MKVYESYDIPLYFLGKITHFCSLLFICDVLCQLLFSLLSILKYDHRISVSLKQYQNFELSYLPFVKLKIPISQILRLKLVTSHSNFIKHKHTKHYEGKLLQSQLRSNPNCPIGLLAV